jgi:FlaA1/EpsC-like NDP-sugar epimerase
MLLRKRTWFIAVLQSLLVFSCLVMAWLLRFDFSFPQPELVLGVAPLLVLLRLLAMRRYNLLHGYWRYTGVSDATDIGKAVLLGSGGFVLIVRVLLGVNALPISIYFLETLLTATSLAGLRILCRMVMQKLDHGRRDGARVLIVGAGAAADALIRELMHSNQIVVGCVDDDKEKRGVKLHGFTVLGTVDDIRTIVAAYQVEEIFIAMPSVMGARRARVVEHCLASGRKFKTIPGLRELMEGRVTVEQLREVKLEELLGRDPVRLDLQAVQDDLSDRVVLVTGAAGSIGQELCQQILDCGPAKLICLDQAETPMFYLQLKLTQNKYGHRVVYSISDITDSNRMKGILRAYGVQVIFNAAAYKHVPLMESNMSEALHNNVFGLVRLLDAAEEAGCERFLLISSDKAVNPSSVMGASKRLGELILASRPTKMRCASVRFGNVLGSQGSVVPIFQHQIRKEGRITVTHPDITRYFMTIPEAVSLVLQAFTIGAHGDVLVLDMGEPIRIADLARTLIRLTGASENDIPILFTGLRPGEKLFEELFYSTDVLLETTHEKVRRTNGSLISWANLSRHLQELQQLILNGSDKSIRAKIQDIVPEYSYERMSEPVASTENLTKPRVVAIALAQSAAAND